MKFPKVLEQAVDYIILVIILADDVFVMDTSGLPYYSKCFGGETCKMQPDHTLQTGFFAAMYAFSKESFGQQDIQTVVFSNLRLHFKIDKEKDLIVVFTSPLSEESEKVEKQLDMTLEKFIDLYGDKIGRGYVDVSDFENFEDTLLELGVVPKRAMKDIPLKVKYKSWWKKIVKRKKEFS